MTEEIMDFVSEMVAPYLIYFGEKGISPKVIDVLGEEIITLKKSEGPRLGEFLKMDQPLSTLESIYHSLGLSIGHISRYCIEHGHLHVDNVVIENNSPVIIDWGMAFYAGILASDDTFDMWKNLNCSFLLDTTLKALNVKCNTMYPELEKVFLEEFRREFLCTEGISPTEIKYKLLESRFW